MMRGISAFFTEGMVAREHWILCLGLRLRRRCGTTVWHDSPYAGSHVFTDMRNVSINTLADIRPLLPWFPGTVIWFVPQHSIPVALCTASVFYLPTMIASVLETPPGTACLRIISGVSVVTIFSNAPRTDVSIFGDHRGRRCLLSGQ